MARILIVDDERQACLLMSRRLEGQGHDVRCAHTLSSGLALAGKDEFDIILLDVGLPDGNGLEALPAFRNLSSEPEVLVVTGGADAIGAEQAIRSGAWDYLGKRMSPAELALAVDRAVEYRKLQRESRKANYDRHRLMGHSAALRSALDQLYRASLDGSNVLLTGETGTGKEVFARTLHENSPASQKPFVVVDCTVLPENLVESTLFGHAKGAFTGATERRKGLVAEAAGGTLFLDEIGDLPHRMQRAFLRVLQERKYRPVGSAEEIDVDFRLVAATNRNLEKLVATGEFREDLLYRLRTLEIHLPALRDRGDDVLDIARAHVKKRCQEQGRPEPALSVELMSALATYNWPGNIRELLNVLDRALTLGRHSQVLVPQHLPEEMRVLMAQTRVGVRTDDVPAPESERVTAAPCVAAPELSLMDPVTQTPRSLKQARTDFVDQFEQEYLTQLMAHTQGHMHEACEISGVARARLYALLKKHGISTKN